MSTASFLMKGISGPTQVFSFFEWCGQRPGFTNTVYPIAEPPTVEEPKRCLDS